MPPMRMTACLAQAKTEDGGSMVAGEKNKMYCVELIPFCMFVSIYIYPGFPESGISTLTSLVRLLEFHRACLSTLLYKSNPERDD
jgi:hypothetical protein